MTDSFFFKLYLFYILFLAPVFVLEPWKLGFDSLSAKPRTRNLGLFVFEREISIKWPENTVPQKKYMQNFFWSSVSCRFSRTYP